MAKGTTKGLWSVLGDIHGGTYVWDMILQYRVPWLILSLYSSISLSHFNHAIRWLRRLFPVLSDSWRCVGWLWWSRFYWRWSVSLIYTGYLRVRIQGDLTIFVGQFLQALSSCRYNTTFQFSDELTSFVPWLTWCYQKLGHLATMVEIHLVQLLVRWFLLIYTVRWNFNSFIRAAVSHYTIISLDYSDVREAHILTYLLFTLKLLIYSQGLQEEPIEASGFTLV